MKNISRTHFASLTGTLFSSVKKYSKVIHQFSRAGFPEKNEIWSKIGQYKDFLIFLMISKKIFDLLFYKNMNEKYLTISSFLSFHLSLQPVMLLWIIIQHSSVWISPLGPPLSPSCSWRRPAFVIWSWPGLLGGGGSQRVYSIVRVYGERKWNSSVWQALAHYITRQYIHINKNSQATNKTNVPIGVIGYFIRRPQPLPAPASQQ